MVLRLYRLFSLLIVFAALVLGACSSNPAKKKDNFLTAADSAAIAEAVMKKIAAQPPIEEKLPQNIDAAHESFVRAMDLELRGESSLAKMYWQLAAESDPYSRYLAFKMAEILAGQGADSLALVQAQRGQKLKGKVTSSQLSLLAHLYVKAGVADSCRKYFKEALDSARYQDMPLLYDYSLFLEAVKDKEELARVYDLLLPQVNYMQSLFQRQLGLLLDLGKDSAVVDLFGRAHEATGDKSLLTKMVQGLMFQKRIGEAQAIVDTLTESTVDDETMVILFMTNLAEKDRAASFAFLRKKYYQDGVRTPLLTNCLGHSEHNNGMLDSAKVHLLQAAKELGDQKAYVVSAYHVLSGIALKENRLNDAVRYAEMSDSVTNGGDKPMLAIMYGSAKMYGKAYKMLDSLIDVWDKWKPMEGIVDSVTLLKMNAEVAASKRQYRAIYTRILISEATDIFQKFPGDTAKINGSLELRRKAQGYYEYLFALDSMDLENRMLMATNLERLGRFEEAFAHFEKLLSLGNSEDLDRPEVLNYYGYTLIDLNRSPEEVERGLNMVLEALSTEKAETPSEAYLDSKAWGLYRLGKYEEALETLKLVTGDRLLEDYIYWEHLAAIQEALGMKKEATESYKKLLKLWPKNPAAMKFLKGAKK